MGYLPPAGGGQLDIQAATPAAKPNRGWWNTGTGALTWYDDSVLVERIPVGEPHPSGGFHAYAAGRASLLTPNPSGGNAIAIGEVAALPNYQSVAIGTGTAASSNDGVAIGTEASNGATYGLAIGWRATTPEGSTGGIAIGGGAGVATGQGIAIGYGAQADATEAIVLGVDAGADGVGAVAIGREASATTGFASVAIGVQASTDETGQVAIGNNATATSTPTGAQQIAIGDSAYAAHVQGIAIGYNARTEGGPFSITLGAGITNTLGFHTLVGTNTLELYPQAGPVGPNGTGIIMPSPDGTRWLLSVDNAGAVTVTAA